MKTTIAIDIADNAFTGYAEGTRFWLYYCPETEKITSTYVYGNGMPAFIYNGHFALTVPQNAVGEDVRCFAESNFEEIVAATNGDKAAQGHIESEWQGYLQYHVKIHMEGEDYIDYCLEALTPEFLRHEMGNDPATWAANEAKKDFCLDVADLTRAATEWLERNPDINDWLYDNAIWSNFCADHDFQEFDALPEAMEIFEENGLVGDRLTEDGEYDHECGQLLEGFRDEVSPEAYEAFVAVADAWAEYAWEAFTNR